MHAGDVVALGAQMRKTTIFSVLACGFLSLGGCGLYVPEMQEWYEDPENQKLTENEIINHIKCELHKGVDAAIDKYYGPGQRSGRTAKWINSWEATVTLKLSVDEKSSLNPGVSWIRPWTDSSFVLGAGYSTSAAATRNETIAFKYKLSELTKRGRIAGECQPLRVISSDLKVGQFIDRKVFLTTVPGTVIGPYSAFNYQVTFVVVYGGSATPTWKLVNLTANPNAPFVSAARSRTHDIAITFSPPNDGAKEEARLLHNATLIGQEVAAALRRTGN